MAVVFKLLLGGVLFPNWGGCFEYSLFKKAEFILGPQSSQLGEGSVAKQQLVPVVAVASLLEHYNSVRLAHEVVAQLELQLTFFAFDALLLVEQIRVHDVLNVERDQNCVGNQYAPINSVPAVVQAAFFVEFLLNLFVWVITLGLRNNYG